MLIQDQYQSPAIDKSTDTTNYYYHDWGCFVHFFAIWGWKYAGMTRDWTSEEVGAINFDLGRVKFLLLGSGLGLDLEIFPLKSQIFQLFVLRVKKNLACWFISLKSMKWSTTLLHLNKECYQKHSFFLEENKYMR